MHPFGGIPICPTCDKTVYAAEQVMGPGRRIYHKPCLKCKTCSRRLDSNILLEHDQEPYCKSCHVKNFGTRDLRSANLTPSSPPASPKRLYSPPPTSASETFASSETARPSSPLQASSTFPLPSRQNAILRPNIVARPMSPTKPSFRPLSPTSTGFDVPVYTYSARPSRPLSPPTIESKTQPISPAVAAPTYLRKQTTGTPSSRAVAEVPLRENTTGTGPSLRANTTGTPRRTFGPSPGFDATPICPKCGKEVYFAEQVKASSRTWHRPCLRCSECSTLLDSTRLTEKDGLVMCRSCYSKLHGPLGGGYALLGKVG